MTAARRSISALITLYLGGALLLLAAVLGLVLQQTTLRLIEQALADKAQALAGQLAVVSQDAILVQDYGTMERYVQALAGQHDIPWIAILRQDGAVLGEAGNRLAREPEVRQAITLEGKPLGEVRLQYDTRAVDRAIRLVTAFLVAGVALLSLLSFFLLRWLINRQAVEPIRDLAGRLTVEAPAPLEAQAGAPLEVEELTRVFNALQARIASHIESLRQASEAQNEAMRRLCSEQRLASIGQMAAELAHEMNTPLSNILGYAQMAQARAQDEDMRHRLEVIVEHARRLSGIVADMMAAVRPPLPRGERVVARDLLASIARLTAPLLANRGIALTVEADEGQAVLWADMGMTEQILFNLISNAFHAGATRIVLHLVPGEGRHCLVVEDDGPGIPGAVRERLFEPFVTGRREGGGTGLGLAISQRLAREMEGELTLLSSGPEGARFQLCLPQDKGWT